MSDCISREAVMKHYDTDEYRKLNFVSRNTLLDFIESLSSVEPNRPHGEWIIEKDCEGKTRTCICNICGYKTGKYTWVNPNFCEECGADMRGDKDAKV